MSAAAAPSTASSHLEPGLGLEIGDRFVLSEKLADGEFTAVWKAQDKKNNKLVAIKMLHPARRTSGLQRRFDIGAEAMGSVSHRAVVRVLGEPCEEQGLRYYAMEYVAGGTLRELLGRRILGQREAIDIVTTIADGLAILHKNGYAHRDIEPDNILLTRDGHPKLTDFEYALIDPTTSPETPVFVAARYAAPELLRGGPAVADQRADVYSLAATLIFCLLRSDPPPDWRDRAPETIDSIECSPGVSVALKFATRENPKQRQQDIARFASQLREAMDREPRPWLLFSPAALIVTFAIAAAALAIRYEVNPIAKEPSLVNIFSGSK